MNIPILDPKGVVGLAEKDLIVTAAVLMALVVIPVFILTFAIAWRYRAGNSKAKYTPNWEHNRLEEFVWWAIPSLIIAALAGIAWTSSHDLDPFKPLDSSQPPLTIQVVALDWKWLFIYPEERIASVNLVEFPALRPINFQITSDAPMNSFWIPQLGGQIYAMAGMSTQLHLMADAPGIYSGASANFSGRGFAGMKFNAVAVAEEEYQKWITEVRKSPDVLDLRHYNTLAMPSENSPVSYYAWTDESLYNSIVQKFTRPKSLNTNE
ncbi:ubiquinol oxidase subunit II [Candidatus Kaiserbacteria bacterium]|nr:ubiquinol oxidase subunit II [Candidatus Kaiserbacteria bacterium]